MGEVMRYRHDFVRARQIERVLCRQEPLFGVHDLRHVLRDHAGFELLDRQNVTVAYHQIDVVERNPFGSHAILHDFLEEAGVMLCASNPLLADRERDLAITKQTGADIVIVSVYSQYIDAFFGH